MLAKNEKIIVAMSGGVDSSVAALRLVEEGHPVEGLFMKNWEADDNDSYCTAEQDYKDAQAVCEQLNIPLHHVNFSREYWQNVFEHFLNEYQLGRTPNPDILCNKEIKFKACLEYAKKLGASMMATGHYADSQFADGHWQLHKGLDNTKDQSYFLYTLGQEQLAHALFPLGQMKKTKIREIAAKHGFINHDKKDSTGICFIGERNFSAFLSEYLLAQPGKIKTASGDEIGEHRGLMFYTIGQRQGLHIGGLKNYKEAPWYVIAKDIERNVLIVDQSQDNPLLYANALICHSPDWVAGSPPGEKFKCKAKIRYRQHDQSCDVRALPNNTFEVRFDEPQRAITPGQSVVFYDDRVCLGGALIQTTID